MRIDEKNNTIVLNYEYFISSFKADNYYTLKVLQIETNIFKVKKIIHNSFSLLKYTTINKYMCKYLICQNNTNNLPRLY